MSLDRVHGFVLSLFLLAVVLGLAGATSAVPAFPGADGYGATTAGGRGGQVIQVWSLADSGPGTLRAAVETSGCRFVMFIVGGTIVLESPLEITDGCITIAGQTAISPGIELANDRLGSRAKDVFPSLIINAPDVVVRHVRVRPAIPDHDPQCDALPLGTCFIPDPANPGKLIRDPAPMCQQGAETPCAPSQEDGIRIGQNDGLTDAAFVVLDHVSASWATDEIVSVMGASDVTIQNSVISEGIAFARYSLASHATDGKGMMFGNTAVAGNGVDTTRISVLNNLFALNTIRNPQATNYCLALPAAGEEDDCAADIVNNLAYGWTSMGILTANLMGHHYSNQIGNVLRKAPLHSHPADSAALSMRDFTVPGFVYRAYLADNVRLEGVPPNQVATPIDLSCFQNDGTNVASVDCSNEGYLLAQPVPTPGPVALPATDVLGHLSANAGARLRRSPLDGSFVDTVDPRDLRVFLDVGNQTGAISDANAVLNGTAAYQLYGAPWPLSQPAAFVLFDSDADAMPDGWETAHCLNPAIANSWQDHDGDGYPDLEEYVNQTLPNDDDHDGLPNHQDNCPTVANPTQLDGDATPDGFGNACDCDLTNDGQCKRRDRRRFDKCINSGGTQNWCPAADMNDDGLFDEADRVMFDASFAAGTPGPGAATCP